MKMSSTVELGVYTTVCNLLGKRQVTGEGGHPSSGSESRRERERDRDRKGERGRGRCYVEKRVIIESILKWGLLRFEFEEKMFQMKRVCSC